MEKEILRDRHGGKYDPICKSFVLKRFTLLLPALKNARDQAKAIVCVGNLKQMGTAMSSYADDYRFYPPRYYVVPTYDGSNTVAWTQMLKPYLNMPYIPFAAGYPEQIKRSGVYICPSNYDNPMGSVSQPPPTPVQAKDWTYTSYAIYQAIGGQNSSQVKTPDKTILLIDAQTQNYFLYRFGASNSLFAWTGLYQVAYPRHSNGENVLFADGHVEFIKNKDLGSSANTSFDSMFPW